MLITKMSYDGIRAIKLLSNDDAWKAEDLAITLGVPECSIRKTLERMKNCGIVCGKRGPSGGYVLGKVLRSISLREIVEAVEGEKEGICKFHSERNDDCEICDAISAFYYALDCINLEDFKVRT